MEQRKVQKDKDIVRYKLLDREIRQECKQAKEDHYNHLCEEIEEPDKHHNPIMYSKVKSMEHKTKLKLGVQNKEGELLTEPELILNRWFEYIGDLFEDEITNTLNPRKEKATIMDKEIWDIIKKILKKNWLWWNTNWVDTVPRRRRKTSHSWLSPENLQRWGTTAWLCE